MGTRQNGEPAATALPTKSIFRQDSARSILGSSRPLPLLTNNGAIRRSFSPISCGSLPFTTFGHPSLLPSPSPRSVLALSPISAVHDTKAMVVVHRADIDTVGGLIAGGAQAMLFNPWDRALYLSVKEHRSFLHKENWIHPYQGFLQSAVQRTLSGGLYFILQGRMEVLFKDYVETSPHMGHLVVGLSAGCLNGMLLNQLATIKYHTWARPELTFVTAAKEMWKGGGIRPFVKGTFVSQGRDIVFGCAYELIRGTFKDAAKKRGEDGEYIYFFGNFFAGGFATMLSAPLNYVRNIKYATDPTLHPQSTVEILVALWKETRKRETLYEQAHYMQQRLRLGWGTARVAVGMAVGQHLFDIVRSFLHLWV